MVKKKKCSHYKACSCKILSYYQNITVNVENSSWMNSFYGAFLHAYNHHEDIILSPDDIMMCVALNFSKYVNDNAEELRKYFVNHEEKKN